MEVGRAKDESAFDEVLNLSAIIDPRQLVAGLTSAPSPLMFAKSTGSSPWQPPHLPDPVKNPLSPTGKFV
jgi:hypothetical protein